MAIVYNYSSVLENIILYKKKCLKNDQTRKIICTFFTLELRRYQEE